MSTPSSRPVARLPATIVRTERSRRERSKLRRELGRLDAVCLLIATIVVLDTLGAVARGGAQTIALLALGNLVVFAALPRLRRTHPRLPRAFRVPGGGLGAWTASGLATAWSALALLAVLWPGLATVDPDAHLPEGFAGDRAGFLLTELVPLAAFDAALLDAGVANYNLISLSSVIPGGSVVRRTRYVTPSQEYGHRLYVVMARAETATVGSTAWAGLGWTQERASGRGLFVELHGGDRQRVDNDIKATLAAMVASRPLAYGDIRSEIVGVDCQGTPVCAVAIAIYRSEPWDRP